jgi:hypothetical protein
MLVRSPRHFDHGRPGVAFRAGPTRRRVAVHPLDASVHAEHRRAGLQRAAARYRLIRRAARPDADAAEGRGLAAVTRLRPRAVDPDSARSPAA